MKVWIYVLIAIMLFPVAVKANKVQKLIMTTEQRNSINSQRALYLNKDQVTYDVKVESLPVEPYQPPVKSNLPDYISVSAVIITPDKKKIIRLNGEYQSPGGADISLDQRKTNTEKVRLRLNGDKVDVPVGYSYVLDSGELIKNYEFIDEPGYIPDELRVEQQVKSREEEVNELNSDLQRLKALTETQ